MNNHQINCTCGASWLIWENQYDDKIVIDDSDFTETEERFYICPKCGRNIEATINFFKELHKIEYPYKRR